MATVQELVALGWREHQAGNLTQALEHYGQVLRLDPNHLDALLLSGSACQSLRRLPEAVAAYEQALRILPDDAEVLSNLGSAYREQGKLDEAIACFQHALRLRPDLSQAHNNLGNAFKDQEKLDEAVACFLYALRLKPDFAEGFSNLGSAYREQGRHEEAEASLRHALRLKPRYAKGHNNLGNALKDQGKLDEARACYQQALRLKPDYAEAYNNLGTLAREQGDLVEAIGCYENALRLNPDDAEAHNNMGNALRAQGRPSEAVRSYQRAVGLKPNDAEAHMNLGMARLLMGDFEHGWVEYEWRCRTKGFPRYPFHPPLWDGSPLEGKTILLSAEQGLGDTIQFVRYAPLVKARGGNVVLECQPSLRVVLAGCAGIDRLIVQGDPLPERAVQAPLMSLPGILGTTLATIPNPVPYLKPDPGRIRRWQQELDASAFRLGIVWRGNPLFPGNHRRSAPLSYFTPLIEIPGVQVVSLQKGAGTKELEGIAGRAKILELGGRLDDFADTSAVLRQLDLLITSDTSVPHLAGALGVPVWLALAFDADWRWLLARDDSPWYPTMRLYRQERPGDWEGVFARITTDFRRLLQSWSARGLPADC